ncbi:hypothetical protein B296_00010732 [Ensete ventricosum]|uniref:Uncharacterized protein n=1 Tax=Ensete ventricosum TaxID=4639 RepID=A0A426ZHP9_ENSVE|nr:hypothetical protein B296_00010732 [Ensete ventricosum]
MASWVPLSPPCSRQSLCLHYAIATAPTLAAVAPCGRQPPCQGATTLAVGAATPCEHAGGSCPLQPGRGRHNHLLLVVALTTLVVAGRPCKVASHGLPPV